MSQSNYQITRLPNYQILTSALLVLVFAVVLFVLQSGLRADSFFVGDPGIKLIVAKHAIARPDHPLDIPLPVIGRESLPYVEPFFEVHADHAHAVTSDLFPLVTAPFIRWFGIRGAYVLPAAGFLGILIGCAWLAVALDPRRNATAVVLLAALAAPFLFYGLEFWEHAPAAALATFATAMVVTSFNRHGPTAAVFAFGAGLVFGLSLLLRPEMAWAMVAVIAASLAFPVGRAKPRQGGRTFFLLSLMLIGAALALSPLELYTINHFGRLMPAHLWANAGLLQTSWVAERGHLIDTWLLPSAWTRSGPVRAESFWTAAPLILLAAVPVRADALRRGGRFLAAVAGVTLVLVLLTAPNDGGAQWAPRYLLFAYIPLVILASDVVDALPKRGATLAMLTVLLLLCVWIQRSAYRDLRGTKLTYGRAVDFVASQVAPGGVIVTDLWWLDQIAASAVADRHLVYAPAAADGRAVMQRLSRAVVPIVTVIRSESESPDLSPWREDTCYVEIKREAVDVRRLVAITLHHRCSQ